MSKTTAGFGVRLLADFIDFLIVSVPIALMFYFIRGEYSFDWALNWQWQIIYTCYLTIIPLLWVDTSLENVCLELKLNEWMKKN